MLDTPPGQHRRGDGYHPPMAASQAVPERFRVAIAEAIALIAAGDMTALRRHPGIRIPGQDPLTWVRDYPATLTTLPAEAWDIADAIQRQQHPSTWSLVIPLWTLQEGRSDLSLEATAQDLADGPLITIDDIRVR
jgi:hypothetical protein